MKAFERYYPDMEALHTGFRTGPCFVCRIVARDPDYRAHIVYEDEQSIAFLDKYPRQYGYTLVTPKRHLVHVTADFTVEEYLNLQHLVYDVCEAIRAEVGAERMYILTLGSNQGNAHVHDREKPRPLGRGLALGVQGGGSTPARGWGESPILGTELGAEGAGAKLRHTSDGRVYWHVVPLPAGTPYEEQQGAAVGWRAGVLQIPEEEMASLAARIRARIEWQRRGQSFRSRRRENE